MNAHFISTELTRKFATPEERAAAAAMPDGERQTRVKNMLVDYPLFREAVNAMASFHRPVEGGVIDTGRICGIIGDSRAGKTAAIRHYAARCGMIDTGTSSVPRVLYVDMQSGWSAADLANAFYRALGFRSLPRLKTQSLLLAAADEIVERGIELVVIDDAQYVLASNYRKTVIDAVGFIVGLADRNTCNVVLAGTDQVRQALSQHPHAWNRGSFPRRFIEPYSWLSSEQQRHFRFLLTAIDNRLPFLEPSGLGSAELAPHFYRLSDGLIGKVMNVVERGVFEAFRDKAPFVSAEHLARGARQDFRTPGDAYQPFVSGIDMEDPAGERRAFERANAEEAHLNKKRPKPRRSPGAPPKNDGFDDE